MPLHFRTPPAERAHLQCLSMIVTASFHITRAALMRRRALAHNISTLVMRNAPLLLPLCGMRRAS